MPDSLDEWIEKVCEADPIALDLNDEDDGETVIGPSLRASSDTTCTRVPSASALNQAA